MLHAFLIAAAVAITGCATTPTPRSPAVRAAFVKANPCPATSEPRGPCPGWVVDHITPLCAGGADAAHNLQWQTVADAKIKDADERRLCRAMRPLNR